ncbi:TPA: ATP-binding protein [Burkholderia orbicola]|uniref:ATP-binding protein n=1 Tax=Burkholderia cenocepacia TaxID=95486 RepID=UPI000F582AC8|nr:winged helix-turn-helix domain-containing protein [Burkholderia cenocepacia]RQU43057.1 transcriptional regulator [Burkholderia cenocepacia]RQU68372.1 transcriptional regulator [Burkholderia cenocepacia]RQV23404.1 transcriptional regulator [Burkholderia cenocepacia]
MLLGTLEVDLSTRSLRRDGKAIHVGSRAFDVLAVLLSAAGRLVTKDELMAAVWPGTVVEENNLQVHISALRKLLGPQRDLIVTVPGRGYQLTQRSAPTANLTPTTPPRQGDSDIPRRHGALTGRDSLVSNIAAILDTTHILTLVGAGGVGKTSAAIEVAHAAVSGRFDITRFVALSDAASPEAVLQKIATAFGVSIRDDRSAVDALVAALPRDRTLLVLDNAEHVIDAVARLVDSVCMRLGNLRVLVTSREPLRVSGERVFHVRPLQVPRPESSIAELLDCEAVQMFLQRARQSGCDLDTLIKSARLVGDICRRLDGNPLAIEMAVGRIGALGVRGVHGFLDDRFKLLTRGYRTALAHHQTLQASFDWSFASLSPSSQKLLGHVAAFQRAFTFEALRALVCDARYTLSDVAGDIAELTEKSLVSVEPGNGEHRFFLSESARAYALQKRRIGGKDIRMFAHYAGYHFSACEEAPTIGTDAFNEKVEERERACAI